jgi:hypothetical protein
MGEIGDKFYVILFGCVKIYKYINGEKTLIKMLY